ncbi:protein AIM2 [Podospora conica]|nr:protein AIM2 [Schizothecium conicum]
MATGFCRDCFTGRVLEDAILTGTEQTVHGLPTYVTGPGPGASRGIVVILPDAFGYALNNTRALADAYARRVPCTVYVPEFMAGNAVPAWAMTNLDFRPPPTASLPSRLFQRTWAIAQVIPPFLRFVYTCRPSVARKRITDFLRAVRTGTSPPPAVGVAGFCWGGFFAVELTHEGSSNEIVGVGGEVIPLIDCAFTAHPSLLKIPRDVERVSRPLSVANGEDDEFMGRRKMEVLRGVMEGKGEERYEVVVYPGAKHGFAVRRDWEDEVQRGAKEGSEDQAVRFFGRFMGVR